MKKFCKILSVLMLVVMLTGCMKIRAKVVIEDEKTASMTMEILYSEKMMDSYGMSLDDLKDQMEEKNFDESDTKEISETIDGEKYVGLSVSAPDEETEKILDELTLRDSNGSKEYTLSLTSDALEETMDPDSLSGAGYSLEQMKNAGLEMTMTIQMPGKIKDSSIGEVKGDTVTIDLLELAELTNKEATIVSADGGSSNSIFLYAAIGVAVVAIVAVAAIVISKKKKKETEEPVVEETVVEETSNDDPVVEENSIEETLTEETPTEENKDDDTDSK